MDKNIICSLLYDLLPSYMEELTSDASNQMIQAHIKECSRCKKQLDMLMNPMDEREQNKKELRFLAKYRYQFLGFIIGCAITILLIILLLAGSLISIKALGQLWMLNEETAKTESYGKFKNFHGSSKLYVFPKSIDNAKEVVDYYYSCKGSKIYPTCQIYLECEYSKEEYAKEVARLAAISEENAGSKNSIRYSRDKFYYPAYYTQYFSDYRFEYALLMEEENKIVYLYLQLLDIDSMVFNHKYFPKNYGSSGNYFGEESDIYNMYLFKTRENENGESNRELSKEI